MVSPCAKVYTVNRSGPSTEPWGTPHVKPDWSDLEPFITVLWLRSLRYEANYLKALPATPMRTWSVDNNLKWSIVSKAADKSNSTKKNSCQGRTAHHFEHEGGQIPHYEISCRLIGKVHSNYCKPCGLAISNQPLSPQFSRWMEAMKQDDSSLESQVAGFFFQEGCNKSFFQSSRHRTIQDRQIHNPCDGR